MGILRKIRLILLGIARGFRLYSARSAVVDPRAINVSRFFLWSNIVLNANERLFFF